MSLGTSKQRGFLRLLPFAGNGQATKKPPGCWVHLVAGALAGGASRTATAPLEVLRIQAITGTHTPGQRNPVKAAKQIVADHGWNALYRGNMLNVVRAVPQKALDFFSFEMYKGWLGADKKEGMGSTFVAAAMAGATSTVILHPLEVIRSRMTARMTGQAANLAAVTSQMVQREGLGSLYRGLLPSILAILPEAAITYGMFDWLKRCYAQQTGQAEAGMVPSVACGVLSSFTGQMVAFPIESVARRMQVQQATAQKLRTTQFVQDVLRKEGPLTFYRGAGTAALKVIPMAAVSFTTYEVARLWLARFASGACDDLLPRDDAVTASGMKEPVLLHSAPKSA
jgi:solute carrier family 25 phosphate transporter 23/24/25/41